MLIESNISPLYGITLYKALGFYSLYLISLLNTEVDYAV